MLILFVYAFIVYLILSLLNIKMVEEEGSSNVLFWTYILTSIVLLDNSTKYNNTYGHEVIYLSVYFFIFTFLFIIFVVLLERIYDNINYFKNNDENKNFKRMAIFYIISFIIFVSISNLPANMYAHRVCSSIDRFWHIEDVIYDEDEDIPTPIHPLVD